MSNSSTKVINLAGLRDALTTAISVWVVEAMNEQERYNAFSVYKNLHLHLIIEKDAITETIFTTNITHIEVEDLMVSTNDFIPYTPQRL